MKNVVLLILSKPFPFFTDYQPYFKVQDKYVTIVKVLKETDKAILVRGLCFVEQWVPKSCIYKIIPLDQII